MSKIKLLRITLFLALLYLAFSSIAHEIPNLKKAKNLFQDINYFWLSLAIVFQTGQYIGDGLLSQRLLRAIKFKINFVNTFKIAAMNVFAAHLLPVGQAGAFATSYYFYQRLQIPTDAIVFLSLAWGIITNILIVLLMLISLSFLPHISIPIDPSTQSLITLIIIVAIVSGAYVFRKNIEKLFKKITAKNNLEKKLQEYKKSFVHYEKELKSHKKDVAIALMGGLIYLMSNVATLAFSFKTFGLTLPLPILIFAYTSSLLLGIITLAPAGLGATEATLILVFAQAQTNSAITLAAILLFRLITFWIPIPVGALAYASLKRETKVQSSK